MQSGISCEGERFPYADFVPGLSWSCHIDQQKTAWLESDFFVNGASFIAILFTMDLFCPQNFTNLSAP